MLKVVIADDEERICQLIRALVDWGAMGMEISGVAHNGLEASELVKNTRPHILITDIRMPGKSGLELIEEVKKAVPDLEIVIISGYAHFEYAKNAIRFGVGDYLLKPVDKTELNMTLEKLKEKVVGRLNTEENTIRLLQKSQEDVNRLQKILIEHLIEKKEEALSFEILQNEYGLSVKPGLCQTFMIKVDDHMTEYNQASLDVVMDKVVNLLDGSIRPRCTEFLIGKKHSVCAGVINYEPKKQDEIRRVLKDCLNQLLIRREVFGSLHFSMALNTPVKKPEQIPESMKETSLILQERLVKGTGRLLERLPEASFLEEKNFQEKYLREIRHAIDVMSLEEADRIVEQMQSDVAEIKDVHGFEILELIRTCGNLFLSQMDVRNRSEAEENFYEMCEQCPSAERLFGELKRMQNTYIGKLKQKHEDNAERPIRQAKQYIKKHFSEQITLEEVSSVVGLSPDYFSVQFKKAEGEGFAKYLINVRMEQAKILLRETNYSVSEICRRVGYNDLKHFTHTFEKASGVKPAVFRKLYG